MIHSPSVTLAVFRTNVVPRSITWYVSTSTVSTKGIWADITLVTLGKCSYEISLIPQHYFFCEISSVAFVISIDKTVGIVN